MKSAYIVEADKVNKATNKREFSRIIILAESGESAMAKGKSIFADKDNPFSFRVSKMSDNTYWVDAIT